MSKYTPRLRQFEHDGFNSPVEVEVARNNATAPSKSECELATSLDSINVVRSHMRRLQQRVRVIENIPGGRAQLSPNERVEYDSIGALLSDLRAAIAKATGSAA